MNLTIVRSSLRKTCLTILLGIRYTETFEDVNGMHLEKAF